MRAPVASCQCPNGSLAPRGTRARGVPRARRAPLAFLENVVRREIVETPALRGHLAWHLGRGAPLDLPVLPGSLENLEFLGSRARLGEWGKQEGQERG